MSKILKANITQNSIYIPEINGVIGILYQTKKPSLITMENGEKVKAGCINCFNPRCMKVCREEIDCSTFSGMSHNMSMDVCPVKAIMLGSDKIEIDERKCIGCGPCVSRCPIGALYLRDNAVVNTENELLREKCQPTEAFVKEQEEVINKLSKNVHTGNMIQENEINMDRIYGEVKKLSQEQQNILARNILICLSNNSTISRHGDVYLRMDGYYENAEKHGVIEVETGTEMLDVARAILDDVAVLSARYAISKEGNSALAICLNFANRRTDYWQEIKDIRDVTGVTISTVTFAILFIFMWNGIAVNDFGDFYMDVDNSSLRLKVEEMLGRKIQIPIGYEGMIENSK